MSSSRLHSRPYGWISTVAYIERTVRLGGSIDAPRYHRVVIQSFAGSTARKVWERKHVRELRPDVQRSAYRKLLILNRAANLNDLRVPPGNRLEKLVGNRAGQHSIRINDQFRICFNWTPIGPTDVEIVDYH